MSRLKLPNSLFVFLIALIAFPCVAQTNSEKDKRWKLSSATLLFSEHNQLYTEIDYNSLLDVATVPVSISEDMNAYQKAAYFDASFFSTRTGVSIGMIKNSDAQWKREVVLGVRFMSGAELLLDYEETANPNNDLMFCLVENSIELEASHLFRTDSKNASLFFGPSIGFGKSFNNDLIIFRSNNDNYYSEESYKAKSSFLLVGHMNAGASLNLYKGVGVRMAVQYGCGYSVRDNIQTVMTRSLSYAYGFEYRFN